MKISKTNVPIVEKDLELVDFSPAKEHEEVLAHVAKATEPASR